MANINVEDLGKSSMKITISIPHEEVIPFLESAAQKLSEETTIPGFRPGKAGYDVVKQRVGEMKIYEAALEDIIRSTYTAAVLEHNIDTVGSPKIDVKKLAPGNDIEYTAEVAIMPRLKKVADWNKLSVEKKEAKVEKKDTDMALKDLARMQTKEVAAKADATVSKNDKIVVSMDIKKEGVPVEGGSSPNHAIYLSEDYYIPGLVDQVVGMKVGDKKNFTLAFPKDHVQKILAGSDAEFDIEIKEIFHLESPEMNDEFAKTLGQKDFAALEKVLTENIQKEKEMEEKQRQEKEMLELLANKSDFEEIPDLLITDEVNKMVHELEHRVTQQGVPFEEYLKNIGKTIATLKLDFAKQALIRIKVAVLLKHIAASENISPNEKEVDEELDKLAKQYGENKEAKERIFSPEYREYTEGINRNKQVLEMLRKAMVK